MKPICCPAAILLLLAVVAPAGAGDLVTLKDGGILVGEIRDVTDTDVTVDVEFPEPGQRRIAREDLSDRTLWRILSRRLDPGDGAGRVALGRWAEERGLLVQALSEYRRAARDAALASEVAAPIAAIEAELSQDLFDRGETYFVQDRPASAKRYFEMVVARYPSTPVAPVARKRLDQVARRIADAKVAAREAAEAARADRVLRRERQDWDADVAAIRRDLHEATRSWPTSFEHSRPVRLSRALERTVHHLEGAWRRARDLDPPPDDVSPGAADEIRDQVKARLVAAYLELGLAYLLRPSLNQAEEYCTRACDLDPENVATHDLHGRIIDAHLASGWWGGVLGRHRR